MTPGVRSPRPRTTGTIPEWSSTTPPSGSSNSSNRTGDRPTAAIGKSRRPVGSRARPTRPTPPRKRPSSKSWGCRIPPTMLGFKRQAMIGIRFNGDLNEAADAIALMMASNTSSSPRAPLYILAEVVAARHEQLLNILTRIRSVPTVISTEIFLYLKLRRQTYARAPLDPARPAEPSPRSQPPPAPRHGCTGHHGYRDADGQGHPDRPRPHRARQEQGNTGRRPHRDQSGSPRRMPLGPVVLPGSAPASVLASSARRAAMGLPRGAGQARGKTAYSPAGTFAVSQRRASEGPGHWRARSPGARQGRGASGVASRTGRGEGVDQCSPFLAGPVRAGTVRMPLAVCVAVTMVTCTPVSRCWWGLRPR